MLENNLGMTLLFAFVVAVAVSFGITPAVKKFANKIGAVDIPRDNRRMHKVPMPLAGGVAIFLGFLVSALIFGEINSQIRAMLIGACVIVAVGVIDDVKELKPLHKMAGELVAAVIPVIAGVRIEALTFPFVGDGTLELGIFSIPVTIIWIIAITNAVNFIDGLDGLAVGISTISSITMLVIAILVSDTEVAIFMAALAGACLGFLPYNFNPAKIFMGDTGALFLGFVLAVTSVQGLFKFYAVVSFAVPFLVLAIPVFDIAFAVIRRLVKHRSPMSSDREHVHHKLIDLGFDQKHAVAILYIISVVMGLIAVTLTASGEWKIIILLIAVILSIFVSMSITFFDKKHNGCDKCEKLTQKETREAAPEAEAPGKAENHEQ